MKNLLSMVFVSGLFLLLPGCNEGGPDSGSSFPDVMLPDDSTSRSALEEEEGVEKPTVVTEGPMPKAVAEQTEYNFGRMALGSKSKTTFEIRNDGEGELNLKAGKPTCQCTQFSLSCETVAPGESSVLTISWDAKKVDRNFQHGGPVFTSDPEREAIQFVVMGRVGVDYEMQPAETWNAGDASEDGVAEAKGIVYSTINADFEIDRIETDVDYVTTKVRELTVTELSDINALTGYEIQLFVAAEFPPGEMEQPFRVFLKGRKDPIGGTVSARRLGPIRILPTPGVSFIEKAKRLSLGEFPAEEGKEVNVMLLVDKLDQPLELVNVEAFPPFVKVELLPMGKSHSRYRLKISVPAGVQRGMRSMKNPAKLKLETNHPNQKFIEFEMTYRAS